MSKAVKSNFVYFRDRAKELGCVKVYELVDSSKGHGAPLDPSNPNGGKNTYKVNDLAVWEYIIDNQ